jgi:PAS domain S-box-containing protein
MAGSQLKPIESEAGFGALFENATVGILVINASGLIQLANPFIEKQFGYTNAELIGKPVEVLIPIAFREMHKRHRGEYFTNPKSRPMGYGLNLYARKQDGTDFPVEISLGHYSIGGDLLAVAFITDITEKKKGEEELKRTEKTLREREAMLASEATALAFLNEAGNRLWRLHDLQQGFQEMLSASITICGADMGNVQILDPDKKALTIVAHIGFEQEFLNYFREVSAADSSACGRALSTRKQIAIEDVESDPSFVPHLSIMRNAGVRAVQSTPLYAQDGSPIGMISTHFREAVHFSAPDLSRVELYARKAESYIERFSMWEAIVKLNTSLEDRIKDRTSELISLLEREKELNELKSRFVSMASHEFRSPLSVILSSIGLIESYSVAEQQEERKKHTRRIKSSVKNLVDILNNFLSLDKLEQGKIEVNREIFDLREFSSDIVEEINAIKKDGQKIEIAHNGENEIFQDRKILRNILLNLFSNAIKYSDNNKKIHFTTSVQDGTVSISIRDEGIGIPEEEQQNMFKTFYRAKNTNNIQGTGLGLNIVKKYVELVDGHIRFSSRYNEGTAFTVECPQK